MRSTIWKKTLICLGAVLFLESPAVSTAFAYTVKAENTDAEAATSNIKSILLIGQDKREGESRQRSDSMILATLDKDQRTVSLTSFMLPFQDIRPLVLMRLTHMAEWSFWMRLWKKISE